MDEETAKNSILDLNSNEFSRTRLHKMIDSVIDKSFILLVAPSGYGKSTLIKQYFQLHKEIHHIDFLFHSDETDEVWLWKRICSKTGEFNDELYRQMMQIELPQSSQEVTYVIRLIKKYVTHPVYLVLDDYQECTSSAMNRLLEAIVQADTMFHIIMLSRIYPDVPYEEMFLKGQCVILNQQNLTLTMKETGAIFEMNNIVLDEAGLKKVYEYTDGWISAVYLSIYEYKKKSSFGGFYGVNHLLKTSIFDKLTSKMQLFLMKVSVFDWFDVVGASYVTEMEITESELFENMEQFGFLSYDEKSHTFVIHALLRNVAQNELKKICVDMTRLYNRAGEWCEIKKSYIMAVKNYKKAGNWEKIAILYAGENGKYMLEQAPEVFEELSGYILEDIWDRHIMAMLNYLYFRAMRESADKIIPDYEKLMHRIQNSGRWRSDKRVLGEMKIILAVMQFNNIEKMNEALREACDILEQENSMLLDKSLFTYGTSCMTVLYYRESSKLLETVTKEKEYAVYYMHLTRGGVENWDDFFDAEYAMLTADMQTAYNLANRVLVQALFREQISIAISCYYIMLKSLLYYGKTEEFNALMGDMNDKLCMVSGQVLRSDIEIVQGYVYACTGEDEKVAEWLRNFNMENCSKQIKSSKSGCLTYGKLLCNQKKWELLESVGNQMIEPYKQNIHIQSMISGYIYKSIALYNLNHVDEAVLCLKKAVALAKPDNIRLTFIENGKELEPVISLIKGEEFFEDMRKGIFEYETGISAFYKERKEAATVQEKPDAYTFTNREAELMDYLREGLRNAQIAEKMHIAQVTVEKNLTSIYRKLGVKNRTAAIRKYEEYIKYGEYGKK